MPASWVKDEGLWDKAKKAVEPDWDSYGDPWAVVAHVYKQMGGQAGEGAPAELKADEAASASVMGALQRAGAKEAYNPDQDRDETGKWSGAGGSKGDKKSGGKIRAQTFNVGSLTHAEDVLKRQGVDFDSSSPTDKGGTVWRKKDTFVASLDSYGELEIYGQEAKESDWRDRHPSFTSLREAAVLDGPKRQVRCILITEGPGNLRDKNYYAAEFIEDAAKKYNGARAFVNHASEAEYKNRPEGDVRQMCGFYRDTHVVTVRDRKTGDPVKAVEGTLVLDESAAGNEALAKIEAQLEYSKIFPDSPEEYAGLSICGSGVREGQAEYKGQKWNRIVGVGQADSVDVVTRPARGGAFLALVESAATAHKFPKEEALMLKKLMALTAEITEATKKLSEAKTDEAKAAATAKIEDLNKQLKEAAKEGEKKEAKDEDMDEAGFMKLIPKEKDETDEAYKARLAKVKSASKGKEAAAPAVESMTADELRIKHPKLFEAVASRVRESEAEKSDDIKAVKTELREAKAKLQLAEDKELATRLLSEAGVPVKLLQVGDLLGMTESEMKREIEKTQAMIEAAGGRVVIPAGAKGGGSSKSAKLSESIKAMKAEAGLE